MSVRFLFLSGLSWVVLGSGCFEIDRIPEAGSGGTATIAGGAGGATLACLECAKPACPKESARCESTSACWPLVKCVLECTARGDGTCGEGCTSSGAVAASNAAAAFATCAVLNCPDECVAGGELAQGGSSGAGGAAETSTGGRLLATGGSTPRGGSGGLGGLGGAGGAPMITGGTSGAGSGGQGAASITWLTLQGDRVPSTLGPNASLGIDGVIYAYGDSCASVAFDPSSRCATGTLCDPGANFQNWGMAIGFNFRNTGKDGDPPDLTRTWNPEEVGVRGFAWEITGTAPALQLWVLDMDPIWAGECQGKSCDIAGPPDGMSSAPLAGQLLLEDMRKDDWNGSGVDYVFDPASVHALQFKLPSIIARTASFAFCVKRLGVVR